MKIYDWHTGPYPARVRIAIGEKGLRSRVEFVSVNLWKGEHKTPEFLEKNYSARCRCWNSKMGRSSRNAPRSHNIWTRSSAIPSSPARRRLRKG